MFKLRRYLRGHYLECVLAPTFKGLEAILQLIVPIIMSQVIDVGIASGDSAYILMHAGALVLLAFFCYAVSIVAQYFSSKLAAQFGAAVRDDLFRHVMTLSREDIDRIGRASLVTRMTNDTQQTQDGLNLFFRLILRSPFIIVGSVIVPVLSTHSTSTRASASILFISCSSTFRLASFMVLRASAIVVSKYNPSGIIPMIAATVAVTLRRIVSWLIKWL